MTNTIEKSLSKNILPSSNDYLDLFGELDEIDQFDIKKEEISAQLTALLSYSNKSRTELSEISGWKKSRVTNILNGRGNLTFKTIWEYAKFLGYEADINFRTPDQVPAFQPWNIRNQEMQWKIDIRIEAVSTSNFQPYPVFGTVALPAKTAQTSLQSTGATLLEQHSEQVFVQPNIFTQALPVLSNQS